MTEETLLEGTVPSGEVKIVDAAEAEDVTGPTGESEEAVEDGKLVDAMATIDEALLSNEEVEAVEGVTIEDIVASGGGDECGEALLLVGVEEIEEVEIADAGETEGNVGRGSREIEDEVSLLAGVLTREELKMVDAKAVDDMAVSGGEEDKSELVVRREDDEKIDTGRGSAVLFERDWSDGDGAPALVGAISSVVETARELLSERGSDAEVEELGEAIGAVFEVEAGLLTGSRLTEGNGNDRD